MLNLDVPIIVPVPSEEQSGVDLVSWRAQSEQWLGYTQHNKVIRLAEDAHKIADIETREAQADEVAEG